jgi:hypothetical protein
LFKAGHYFAPEISRAEDLDLLAMAQNIHDEFAIVAVGNLKLEVTLFVETLLLRGVPLLTRNPSGSFGREPQTSDAL